MENPKDQPTHVSVSPSRGGGVSVYGCLALNQNNVLTTKTKVIKPSEIVNLVNVFEKHLSFRYRSRKQFSAVPFPL